MGIAALCSGIVGVLFGLIPLTFLVALVLGCLGLVFGLVGVARTRKGSASNPGTAIAGTVSAALAVALGIWGATMLFQATDRFVDHVRILGVPGAAAPAATAPQPAEPPAAASANAPSSVGAFRGAGENDVIGKPGDTLTVGTMQVQATRLRVVTVPYLGRQRCTTVTYTNTGTTQGSYNTVDWKLQNPAGAAVGSSFGGPDDQLNSGDLAAGGTQTGDVCFDDKSNITGRYVLLYAPGIFSSDAARGAWLN